MMTMTMMIIMCDQCGKSNDPVDNPMGPGPALFVFYLHSD